MVEVIRFSYVFPICQLSVLLQLFYTFSPLDLSMDYVRSNASSQVMRVFLVLTLKNYCRSCLSRLSINLQDSFQSELHIPSLASVLNCFDLVVTSQLVFLAFAQENPAFCSVLSCSPQLFLIFELLICHLGYIRFFLAPLSHRFF